jgi:LmbE family N-acetylglucosaminyl deacetylase
VQFIVDYEHPGTAAEAWASSKHVLSAPPLGQRQPARVVVVAPHPDDEILGAGGLLQEFIHQGIEILIVAVTDGEASHPKYELADRIDLRSMRAMESLTALRRLGISRPDVVRLRVADGQVRRNIERLEADLLRLLDPADLCLAPWDKDGHPDHDASGAAVRNATGTVGNDLLYYLVWALHWADPGGNDLPWLICRRHELSARQCARKRRATLAFRSQIRPLDRSCGEAPVLPVDVLRRHWLDHELFIDPGSIPYEQSEINVEPDKERA